MRALLVFLVAAAAALGQPVPKFPAATATWQDLLVAKPMARAMLTAGISDVATAIPVSDGAQYAAFSAVQVQDEVILICSVDGNTLNVCPGGRGFSGTAAAPHGIGLAVRNTITTHHHNQLAAEVKAIEEALGPSLSNVASSWDNISGKPTTFLFSDQSYTDPAWLTLTKGKVGLGNVENTALSTWSGSANITALGTIASGTVPWARLSGAPAIVSPASGDGTRITAAQIGCSGSWNTSCDSDVDGNLDYAQFAGSATNANAVTNGVYTTASYSDPPWLTLSKAKVGLGSVENTALSTWAGSANITTLGTIASGTVPWARLSSVPATFAPSAHTHGTADVTNLSSWAGSTAITTLGTIATGTVPWARLSGVPGTYAPSAHSHAIGDLSTVGDYSSKITSGSYSINISGTAAAATTATNATNTLGYANSGNWNTDFQNTPAHNRRWGEFNSGTNAPSAGWWFVDNMRHSNGGNYWGRQIAWGWEDKANQTWTRNVTNGSFGTWYQFAMADGGTYNLTAAAANSVAWGNVSSRPTALSQFTNDSGFQTASGSVNYATSAGSANSVAWANVTGKGSGDGTRLTANQLGCAGSYNTSCDPGGNGYIDYADGAGYATTAGSAPANGGNADTTDGLHVHGGVNNEANKIVRTDGNGYINTGYINTNIGVDGGSPTRFFYDNGDNYIRKTSLDTASKAVFNARTRDASWMWQDDYIALPLSMLQWGVFTPRAAGAYIQSVVCWADTGDAVIQLRRNDGGDMINGNLACNGSASTNLNGYRDIPVGYYVGMWAVSGSAKSIRTAITYTTAY